MNAITSSSAFKASNIAPAWLTESVRADLARQFDCAPAEVEARLAARARMEAQRIERDEDEYSHRRAGFRYLSYAEMVF